jgi:hypothetical protein
LSGSCSCLSVLAEKMTQTTFTDDRRVRKELQVLEFAN